VTRATTGATSGSSPRCGEGDLDRVDRLLEDLAKEDPQTLRGVGHRLEARDAIDGVVALPSRERWRR
jgi:hypothetical protein